jgi:hypothetical protein
MSSQAQIDANRLNAQKSTGPRTPEGRAAVRLNGVKHGLSAKTLVLEDESESDFHAIFDALEAEYEPSTPTEEQLVSQLAMASWRLRRLYHIESAFFCVRTIDLRPVYQTYKNLDPVDHLAIVVDRDSQGHNTIAKLCRYEAGLERSFYRALHELKRFSAQRPPQDELKKPEMALVCNSDPRKASEPKSRAKPPSAAVPKSDSTAETPSSPDKQTPPPPLDIQITALDISQELKEA